MLLVLQKEGSGDGKRYSCPLEFDLTTKELRSASSSQRTPDPFESSEDYYEWDGRTSPQGRARNPLALVLPDRTVYVSGEDSTNITIKTETKTQTVEQVVDLKQSCPDAAGGTHPILVATKGSKVVVLAQYFRQKPGEPGAVICGLCLTEIEDGKPTTHPIDMNGECCVNYNAPGILVGDTIYFDLRRGIGMISLDSLKVQRLSKVDELQTPILDSLDIPEPNLGINVGFWNNVLLLRWSRGDGRISVWGLDLKTQDARLDLLVDGAKVTGPENSVTVPSGYVVQSVFLPNK